LGFCPAFVSAAGAINPFDCPKAGERFMRPTLLFGVKAPGKRGDLWKNPQKRAEIGQVSNNNLRIVADAAAFVPAFRLPL